MVQPAAVTPHHSKKQRRLGSAQADPPANDRHNPAGRGGAAVDEALPGQASGPAVRTFLLLGRIHLFWSLMSNGNLGRAAVSDNISGDVEQCGWRRSTKVVVIEACRSPRFLRVPVGILLSGLIKEPLIVFKLSKAFRTPRFLKPTEGILLSRFFKKQGIEFELFTNDYSSRKEDKENLDADLIRHSLAEPDVDIAHFAVHGDNERLVLEWHQDRIPEKHKNHLEEKDIRAMTELDGILVVSGTCASAPLAPAFLSAGVRAVIAPTNRTRREALGHFFVRFYEALLL